MDEAAQDSLPLAGQLHSILRDFHAHPYPYVPCPGQLKKRASVALILRVKPRYEHWPAPGDSKTAHDDHDVNTRLERFFAQEWVHHGEPECLFIKRAARKGDRWEGHVALPGGRRDPEDSDDQAAAIRETSEEVGIDLSPARAIAVGNLPQRLVTTSWGKVPLMVLCPYIFLLDDAELPPQRLQPTEVASTHWVPLRTLLSAKLRTFEYQDVSSRLARQNSGFKRLFLRSMLGKMMFSAIRLVPSESVHCSTIPDFMPHHLASETAGVSGKLDWLFRPQRNRDGSPPLLLWGLTLGVLTDFLDMLPPHTAIQNWKCPTFSPPDIRFMIWLLSYRFNSRKQQELRGDIATAVDSGAAPGPGDGSTEEIVPEAGIDGLGSGLRRTSSRRPNASAISLLLEGYYDIIRRALILTLVGRATMAGFLFTLWWRRRY